MRQFLVIVFGALLVAAGVLLYAGRGPLPTVEQVKIIAQHFHGIPSGTPLTPAEMTLGVQRAARARAIGIGYLFLQWALLAGFFVFRGPRWLSGLVARIGRHWLLGLSVVLGLLYVAAIVLMLPLDYYSDFVFAHQYGLSNQTTLAWMSDHFLGLGVNAMLGFPVAALLYGLLRWRPRTWWLWMAAASVPISLFLMLIEPLFVAPLFNRFTPLEDTVLRREILTMAQAQGVPAHNIFQMDASRQSNAVNAYVIGVGPALRIVLYDTLLKYFTHAEIKHVMAHEIGHYVHKDIETGIALSVVGTLLLGLSLQWISGWVLGRWGSVLGVSSLGQPASFPLLLALVLLLSLIATPIGNAISRRMEWRADVFASHIDPDHAAGIAVYYKLARLNISELNPPRWVEVLFGTHPTLAERIAYLKGLENPTPNPSPTAERGVIPPSTPPLSALDTK